MNTTRTMPHLSAPVERTITGTAASDTVSVVLSEKLYGSNPLGLPFAGDDDN
ncbi:hypothetical protein [Streptosporangium carneum]|uniref:Uncharacterized protein n=1 Tax=Streptosporangium carneum TaxID=47481 RepID=A0A9W6IBZ1_9ACTN|nr:hypothetical protein [Streptosporangium carneum]GLK14888.1 hypothetical protein GCM10017600_83010 [Streptosporangium carneum]